MTKYRVGSTHNSIFSSWEFSSFSAYLCMVTGTEAYAWKSKGKTGIALLSKTLQVTENWIEESMLIIFR